MTSTDLSPLQTGPFFYSGTKFDPSTIIPLKYPGAPYIEFDAPTTINSLLLPTNTCVTFFDGPTYSGKYKTYCASTPDIAAAGGFTTVTCYVVQYSKVPFINSENIFNTKTPVVFYENIFFNRITPGFERTFYEGVHTNLDLKIQSIRIFDGTAVDITDSNNHTETFYHDVHFSNAFDSIQSSSTITRVTVRLLNAPSSCSINDDIVDFMLSPVLITLIVSLFCTFAFLMVASSRAS
jgi:hypothetical protein